MCGRILLLHMTEQIKKYLKMARYCKHTVTPLQQALKTVCLH